MKKVWEFLKFIASVLSESPKLRMMLITAIVAGLLKLGLDVEIETVGSILALGLAYALGHKKAEKDMFPPASEEPKELDE
jgi:hypothetical protein